MAMQPLLHNGDGVELVVEDDKNEPALTLRALKKLTGKDKVSAVLILSGSGPMLEIASIADTYKTPILVILATHPDITDQNSFISQLCFDDNFQGMVAALFVMDELLLERVAVFRNPENAYSRFLATRFMNKFQSIGGRITESVELTGDNVDYTGMLETIRSKKTDLLYLPVRAEDLINIVKALDTIGWEPQILGSDGLLATVLTQHKDESSLLEGILATDFFSPLMPLTPFGKQALKQYRSLHDTPPSSYTVMGGEGYALLLNAMNRCETSGDKECIDRMIRSTVDFNGITGKITIQPDGKAIRPIVVNSIKRGRLEFIVKVY